MGFLSDIVRDSRPRAAARPEGPGAEATGAGDAPGTFGVPETVGMAPSLPADLALLTPTGRSLPPVGTPSGRSGPRALPKPTPGRPEAPGETPAAAAPLEVGSLAIGPSVSLGDGPDGERAGTARGEQGGGEEKGGEQGPTPAPDGPWREGPTDLGLAPPSGEASALPWSAEPRRTDRMQPGEIRQEDAGQRDVRQGESTRPGSDSTAAVPDLRFVLPTLDLQGDAGQGDAGSEVAPVPEIRRGVGNGPEPEGRAGNGVRSLETVPAWEVGGARAGVQGGVRGEIPSGAHTGDVRGDGSKMAAGRSNAESAAVPPARPGRLPAGAGELPAGLLAPSSKPTQARPMQPRPSSPEPPSPAPTSEPTGREVGVARGPSPPAGGEGAAVSTDRAGIAPARRLESSGRRFGRGSESEPRTDALRADLPRAQARPAAPPPPGADLARAFRPPAPSETPRVHIGQVEVVVTAPAEPQPRPGAQPASPVSALASRLYLRRL